MEAEYPRESLSQLLDTRDGDHPEHEQWLDIVDAVFFASLFRDEGHIVRLGVVYHRDGADGLDGIRLPSEIDPACGPAWHVTKLEAQALSPKLLAKLARALDFGHELLLIEGSGKLRVVGIARLAAYSDGGPVPVFTSARPGTLVLHVAGEEKWRFENGRVEMEPVNVLREEGPVRDALARIGLVNVEEDLLSLDLDTFITRLLRNMSATGAGGILAILPEPMTPQMGLRVDYRLAEPELLKRQIDACRDAERDLFVAQPAEQERRQRLLAAVEDTLAMLGRLSAIDGAILMGPHFAVYGAGYIIDAEGEFEAFRSREAKITMLLVEDDERHGARHNAAFSFAYANPDGVAFVISEDGPALAVTRIQDRVVYWRLNIGQA